MLLMQTHQSNKQYVLKCVHLIIIINRHDCGVERIVAFFSTLVIWYPLVIESLESSLCCCVSMAHVISCLSCSGVCVSCGCVPLYQVSKCKFAWACVCAFTGDWSGRCTGGEGQSKLGVLVRDKPLDLINLTNKDVERWSVGRWPWHTHTHTQTNMLNLHHSVNNISIHALAGTLCLYAQLEHVVLGSG